MADRTAFGHIKISRKAFDAEHGDDFWHEPRVFSRFEAWLDLIQLAQWSRRNHAGTMLERGQFVASVRTLGMRWRWSKSRVNRYLATVEKSGRVAGQGTTAHGTVYLIVKYDSYQSANTVESPESGTPRGTAAGQRRDKNKQEKQESNTTLPLPAPSDAGGSAAPVFALAPFIDAWRAKFGGDPPAARFGKVFKRLVVAKGYGPDEVLRRWKVCLDTKGDYATPEELAGKWDRYAERPALQTDDPTAPGFIGVVDGWYSPELERLTRPDGYTPRRVA